MAAGRLAAALRAQEAALQSEGFVVKNCFIDESPCQPPEVPRARGHSAPPWPAAPPGAPAGRPPARARGGGGAPGSAQEIPTTTPSPRH
ncbi:unnamed protein product [Prorocentrum cordatum]|uniref:Uncharacterized protein n=1 Tax=Prorocentrum cordatum TaxID=2364126 RepID=A0ABN9WW02_9DINO|nr:unnamed protein product [Polarella glacialis]